jgi:prevent-host-death family protein
VYMHVGIRELRADLANAVRRAGAGESIVVTVGGRPVARLGPLDAGGGPSLDELIAAGALVPPRHRRRAEPDVVDVPVDATTERALREVR